MNNARLAQRPQALSLDGSSQLQYLYTVNSMRNGKWVIHSGARELCLAVSEVKGYTAKDTGSKRDRTG